MLADTAFEAVMRGCAEARPGRSDTWINDEILELYATLHRMGRAHSVEAWQGGELAGGLYGVALGGGAEIALACDIRLAVPHAQFAHTEINWGMIPAAGAHQRLRNVVGLGMAKEIMFTGRKLEAEEAGRLGIYNHIYAPDQLMPEAMTMASTIAGHSPLAVRQSKKVYDTGAYSEEDFEFEYQASIECYTDGEAMTGAKRFKK